MRKRIISFCLPLLLFSGQSLVYSQTASFHGQLSGWLTDNQENGPVTQTGIRYIPDAFFEMPVSSHIVLDSQISLNTYVTTDFDNHENPETDGDFKPHRVWARISGHMFEVRAGLQKINFGSAALFRPLMWFDHIDPRDPIKLTDGVCALLLRYYFQNNANIWLWGLYNNDEVKGWETAPTEENGLEFGGRLQLPIPAGEAGISYHKRKSDFSQIPELSPESDNNSVGENRFAFDCKLDVEIGLWFEGTIVTRDTNISLMKYKRMYTVGTDYTFNVWNGLNLLAEFFHSENTDEIFGSGERIQFVGSSINYPIGLIDQVSGIYYYDLTNYDNYFSFQWLRRYDNWALHLIGFFNPETDRIENNKTTNVFTGNGFQIIAVYNY